MMRLLLFFFFISILISNNNDFVPRASSNEIDKLVRSPLSLLEQFYTIKQSNAPIWNDTLV